MKGVRFVPEEADYIVHAQIAGELERDCAFELEDRFSDAANGQ